MKFVLLQCVGQAVIENAAEYLVKCLPFGAVLWDIAEDAARIYNERCPKYTDRCAEVEKVTTATVTSIQLGAEQAAAAATSDPDARRKLTNYLARMPGVVRRSLSRPRDVRGLTVPTSLSLDKPEHLVPFLPPRPPRFEPNQCVNGHGEWVLEEMLGVGGFGEVWRAHQAHNPKEVVALKFCLDSKGLDSFRMEKKLQELMASSRAKGIVKLRFACFDADPPYLAYEYISGGDLVRLISSWHESSQSKRLIPESVRLIQTLAESLVPAHDLGPVHRDLKPSNILLRPNPKDENRVSLRIADFGIGGIAAEKAINRNTSSREAYTTGIVGAHTPLYASPQQINGEPADPRDDVYALGVLGWQVLTGVTTAAPQGSDWKDDLEELKVPSPVIDVLGNCLAYDREDRLPNAAAVVEALTPLMTH